MIIETFILGIIFTFTFIIWMLYPGIPSFVLHNITFLLYANTAYRDAFFENVLLPDTSREARMLNSILLLAWLLGLQLALSDYAKERKWIRMTYFALILPLFGGHIIAISLGFYNYYTRN